MSQADFFLKIDGIQGESKDSKFSDQIELLSWNFGASNSGSSGHGTGAGTGKVAMRDFSFTMLMNKASPNLFKAVASGKHISEAVLTCRKSTGDGGQDVYLTVTFNDIIISSYATSASDSGGSVLPYEAITFNFTKIRFEYKPQSERGNLGAPVTSGWDVKANKAVG
jgi:type VI secretion system secreted protein Hcp